MSEPKFRPGPVLAARVAALPLAAIALVAPEAYWLSPARWLYMVGALVILGLGPLGDLLVLLERFAPWERAWRALTVAALVAPLAYGAYRFAGDPQMLWPGLVGAVLSALGTVALGALLPGRLGFSKAPGVSAASALASLQLVVAFFSVHIRQGTLEELNEKTAVLRTGLFLGTWAVTAVLTIVWAHRGALLVGQAARGWRAWVVWLLAVGTAVGAAVADRVAFPGLYPALHAWLGYIALGSAQLVVMVGLGWLLRQRPEATKPVAGSAAAVGLAALAFTMLAPHGAQYAFRAGLSGKAQSKFALSLRRPAPIGDYEVKDHPALSFENHFDAEYDAAGKHHIVVITIDTLRGDYVGEGEKFGQFAPFLAELGAQSLTFERAYAPGPRTAMGMGSFLLGQYSAAIDWNLWIWHRGRIYDPAKLTEDRLGKMKGWGYTTLPTFPSDGTIAERVQAAGYETVAVPYAYYAKFFQKGNGFERGFGVYRLPTKVKQPSSEPVLQFALAQFDAARRRAPTKRVYQWVHLFDPHEADAKRDEYGPLVKVTDDAIRGFVEGLRQRGVWDETALIIVADHGEAMGEHNSKFHGSTLYDEQVRVPMIVRIPGAPGRRIEAPASTIDAAVTAVALAGGKLDGLDGVNLVPAALEGRYPMMRPVFTEKHRYQGKSGKPNHDGKAVVIGDWKLIYDRLEGWFQLYDLASDPEETRNRLAARPEKADEMIEILVSFIHPLERAHPLPGIDPPGD